MDEIDPKVLQRFWLKVVKTKTCWEWVGRITLDGYGEFRFNNTMIRAHRFSYEMFKGEIPKGLELDHLCRKRDCINPEHLEAVTHRENIIRGDAAKNRKAKPNCPHGHPYSGSNLGLTLEGARYCKQCKREQIRLYRIKQKQITVIQASQNVISSQEGQLPTGFLDHQSNRSMM